MDAKNIAKKVVNVALKPAEVVLDVVNKADRAIHNITDERQTAYGQVKPMYSNKGTQDGHHVTDGANHTKPVSMPANSTKPMSKEDMAARKQFGSKSWNNGYTN